jgi:hypothetical protein
MHAVRFQVYAAVTIKNADFWDMTPRSSFKNDIFKCTLLALYQNAEQNYDINTVIRSFEDVAQLKYLGKAVTNQNLIKEAINWRINSHNDSYHSVENYFFSPALYN